ncbi:hypothetical protein ABZZ79_37190 [Streptomyces sp. NPDC006458]|uniref:hypothetical protein n=1 Tax=Streptomyces sp. NPDC006458 TaxID=3154302 RepID=UPI00339FD7E4
MIDTPATAPTEADVAWPTPDTIVLRGRKLRPGVARAELSRFADAVWVLDHAQADDHSVGRCLHWAKFPRRFERPIKAFTLAVLDHPRRAVLTLGPPGDSAALGTLRTWRDDLLVFT